MSKKFAIITGATSGIGQALAELLIVEHNLFIYAMGKNKAALQQLSEKYTANYIPIYCDLQNLEQITHIADIIDTQVHYVIHCATTLDPLGNLATVSPIEFSQACNINFISILAIIQAVLPQLISGSRILNVSTRAATTPIPGFSTHCITKAALKMLTQILRQELNAYNILVTDLLPGVVNTPAQQRVRSLPEDIFPVVRVFQEYEKNNTIISPSQCAKYIAQVLLHTDDDAFLDNEWNYYNDVQYSEAWEK
jgi:benzil reductase ((S)-benzoin forming)